MGDIKGSGTKSCTEFNARFRPVAERAAHHTSKSRARLYLRRVSALECDLDPGVNFKKLIRGKKQSRLAHINCFTGGPVVLAFQPVAQGNVEFVAHCALARIPRLCHGTG